MANYTGIDKLRELAEAATPGPWQGFSMDDVAGCSVYDRQWLLATIAWYDHDKPMSNDPASTGPGYIDSNANAAFIAACSPDVILTLTAELAGLRTEVDQLRTDNERLTGLLAAIRIPIEPS